jgi:hypothetical protein
MRFAWRAFYQASLDFATASQNEALKAVNPPLRRFSPIS